MKNQLQKLTLVILSALFIVSCTKEDDDDTNPNPVVGNAFASVVYIYEGNVYLVSSRGIDRKQLTFHGNAADDISISYDQTKIGYLNNDGVPCVIDTSGKFIDSLVQYPNSNSLHWAPNNKTLLFNTGYKLNFWGVDLKLKQNISILGREKQSFALSKNMDYAYAYDGKIYFQKANTDEWETLYNGWSNRPISHMKFTHDSKRLFFSNEYYYESMSYIFISSGSVDEEEYLGDFPSFRDDRNFAFNKDESEVYLEVWEEGKGYNIKVLNSYWHHDDAFSKLLLPKNSSDPIPFDAK